MNIGFDLDRIFIDYPPFVPSWLIDYLYKNHNHGLSYRIPKGKFEILIRRLSHFYLFRPPISQNIALLHTLHKHKLHLISSRYNFLQDITYDVLTRYHIASEFDSINLNLHNEQAHLFKLRVIKQLKIDYFIDDDYQLLQYLATQHLPTKLYCLRPKLDEVSTPSITVVDHLGDLFS